MTIMESYKNALQTSKHASQLILYLFILYIVSSYLFYLLVKIVESSCDVNKVIKNM